MITNINEWKQINEEKEVKLFIDFLNKEKNFKRDRKIFTGTDWNKVHDKAVVWGRENLEKFHSDMIKDAEYNNIDESVPFEQDIRDVFPDIDTQELKTMFYGSGYEEDDLDEIREDIVDDIKTVFEELTEDGIDYTKLTQSEFLDELIKRIEPLHPRYEKLYGVVFKELITDPDQLELKFEAIKNLFESKITYKGRKVKRTWPVEDKNKVKILLHDENLSKIVNKDKLEGYKEVKEYFGGVKKGVNIWKFDDLKDSIKDLLKNGIDKEKILSYVHDTINATDVVEQPELNHVVESSYYGVNKVLPKIGETVEQIVLTKYFDKAYIYFTDTEKPIVLDGDFEHLENHPDITIELDPPKIDEANDNILTADDALENFVNIYFPNHIYANIGTAKVGEYEIDHDTNSDGSKIVFANVYLSEDVYNDLENKIESDYDKILQEMNKEIPDDYNIDEIGTASQDQMVSISIIYDNSYKR